MSPGVAQLKVLLAVDGEEGDEFESQTRAPDGVVVVA